VTGARHLRALLLLLLAPLALGQAEPRLVPEVSNSQIEIRYSFSGEELLLYGAVVYPDGRPPQAGTDIAVVIKGPLERIVVREKQRVAGIWMNVGRTPLPLGPGFLRRRLFAAAGRDHRRAHRRHLRIGRRQSPALRRRRHAHEEMRRFEEG
jgi:hypothetical protein